MEARAYRSRLEDDVDRLRALLLEDARTAGLQPEKPLLLMLAGLPGSGKSTFACAVTSHVPFVVLESDRLRKALVGSPEYTGEEHSRVFRACHRLIHEFLARGYPVLFDATNLAERNRKPVYAIARKAGAPLAIAVVTAPTDVIRRRLGDREAGVDPAAWSDAGWEIYSRMAPAWVPVKRPHILVDTSMDTGPALQQVLTWARSCRTYA